MERTWLKKKRQEQKMSMAQISAAAGIAQSYYSDIENGKRNYHIPVRTAMAIASVLGFPWKEFYESENIAV